MELKNSLYQITGKETNGTAVSYDLQLDASHVIYQAHFPGEPITPGVCIIQIAKELLEESDISSTRSRWPKILKKVRYRYK